MKANRDIQFLLAILILASVGYAVWRTTAGRTGTAGVRSIRFYQDSMHPWVKSDQPGKCTICAMDLTPIYEGDKGFGTADNLVVLSSNSITVLNVQTEEVKRRPLERSLRVAGTLEANETRKTIFSAPAAGRVEELAVEYAGAEVSEGQKLFSFYSPDLALKRRFGLPGNSTVPGGSIPGATPSEPRKGRLESAIYYSDLVSPMSGLVVERNVYNGQFVAEGERLFVIVDASELWFRFDVYEGQLAWFEPGQTIEVSTLALPGKKFPAVITFIDPMLNTATRTVKVRADIKNPVVNTNGHARRLLRFGMYAEGLVHAEIPKLLAIPRSAILRPGATAYAYVDKEDGAYERRLIKLGRQGDDLWEVLDGIEEGDRVVTAGNVLMDAQAQFNQGSKPEPAAVDEAASTQPDHAPVPMEGAMTPSATPAGAHAMTAPGGRLDGGATVRAPANPPPMAPGMEPMMGEVGATHHVPGSTSAPVPNNPSRARLDLAEGRMTLRDELRAARMDAIAEASRLTQGVPPPVTDTQSLAVLAARAKAEALARATALAPTATNAKPSDSVMQMPGSPSIPLVAAKVPSHAVTDQARMAVRDEMSQMRMAAIAEARAAESAATNTLSANQLQAVEGFVALAGDISVALAADDLGKANQCITNLSGVLQPLIKEFGAPHRWSGPIQRIVANRWLPAKDLAEARKQFLPFSAATVEWVKQLRKEERTFAGLKVYHCPMASPPGLWMQTRAPLRNPFFGSKMLTCGEEVR